MPNPVNINAELDTNDLIFTAPAGVGVTRADEYDLDLSGAIIGQPITISLTADDPIQYDTFLQVLDANTGNVLADSDDDGGSLNSLIQVGQPANGIGSDDPGVPNELFVQGGREYKIRVTSFGGLDQPGSYPYFLQVAVPQGDINVTPRGRDFNGEVQAGSFININGELDKDDFTFPAPNGIGNTLVDEYKLDVQVPGQLVNVAASTNDFGFNPYLEVINAETGSIIAFDNNSGGGVNPQLSFQSQPNIDYRVRITNFSATTTDNIGAYRLDVNVPQGNVTLTARGEGGRPDPDPGGREDVVRFWDEQALAHIFTANRAEADELTGNPRYNRERIEFRAPLASTPGVLPIYRYENQTTETKFYSPQPPEIISRDFPILQSEGIAFYGFSPNEPQPPGTVVVHRFFNEGASQPGSPVHFYTATEANRQNVIDNFPTFREEVGAGWFAFPGDGGFA